MKLNTKKMMLNTITASLVMGGMVTAGHAERANRGNPELAYRGQSIDQIV